MWRGWRGVKGVCFIQPHSTSSNLIGTQLVNEVAGAHCLRKPSKRKSASCYLFQNSGHNITAK
jgi:hypothetical protein